MNIQNISGATDAVPVDFSVNTNVSNEQVKANTEVRETPNIPKEENKGNYIDVKA